RWRPPLPPCLIVTGCPTAASRSTSAAIVFSPLDWPSATALLSRDLRAMNSNSQDSNVNNHGDPMARKYMAKSFDLKEAVRHRLRLPPESIGVINGLVGPIGNKHGLVGPRHAIVIGISD